MPSWVAKDKRQLEHIKASELESEAPEHEAAAIAVAQGRSKKQGSSLCCMLLLFVSVPLHAAAQSSEEHDVEVVSAQDVGPFRPQNDPGLKKVAQSIEKQTNEFREPEGQELLSSKTAADRSGIRRLHG